MKAANKAANNVKNLPVLKKIGVDLLRKLCNDPSSEETEAIIKAVEAAIPDKNTAAHARLNIN